MAQDKSVVTVGVLALQGAFSEHIQLLRQAVEHLKAGPVDDSNWRLIEVRTPEELAQCDGLVIPGGESTTISLVAERSGLLQPLRDFVKVQRKPTWGTCAGLILLAESANRTKKGGQELIGGLNVRVNRNHFGRQVESFQVGLQLPFLLSEANASLEPRKLFRAVFIRAPVVEKIYANTSDVQNDGADALVTAPKGTDNDAVGRRLVGEVEVMARLPNASRYRSKEAAAIMNDEDDIIAVRQGNVFGTSFHPELTNDPRIHMWWLQQVRCHTDNIVLGMV